MCSGQEDSTDTDITGVQKDSDAARRGRGRLPERQEADRNDGGKRQPKNSVANGSKTVSTAGRR